MKTPEKILEEIAQQNLQNINTMVSTKEMVINAMVRYAINYHKEHNKSKLSYSEINHILTLIKRNEDDRCYSGNQLQYWKRSERIKNKLTGQPEPKFTKRCISCGCELPEGYIGSCYGCDS